MADFLSLCHRQEKGKKHCNHYGQNLDNKKRRRNVICFPLLFDSLCFQTSVFRKLLLHKFECPNIHGDHTDEKENQDPFLLPFQREIVKAVYKCRYQNTAFQASFPVPFVSSKLRFLCKAKEIAHNNASDCMGRHRQKGSEHNKSDSFLHTVEDIFNGCKARGRSHAVHDGIEYIYKGRMIPCRFSRGFHLAELFHQRNTNKIFKDQIRKCPPLLQRSEAPPPAKAPGSQLESTTDPQKEIPSAINS